jgi:hypothetical protein
MRKGIPLMPDVVVGINEEVVEAAFASGGWGLKLRFVSPSVAQDWAAAISEETRRSYISGILEQDAAAEFHLAMCKRFASGAPDALAFREVY